MERSRYFLSIGILIGGFLFFTQKIFACSCLPHPPVYESFKQTDAVFIGKVTGSNQPKGDELADNLEKYIETDIIFDVDVIESFKGVKEKKVKINAGVLLSSCYSGFVTGETYLFYVQSDAKARNAESTRETVFISSFCTRTSDIKAAKDQLYFIREMLKGKPEPQIYGSVVRNDRDPASFENRHDFLEGIKVAVEGENKRFETVTSKNGVYEFDNIPPGRYSLKALAGEDYDAYSLYGGKITVLPNGKTVSERRPDSQSDAYYGEIFLSWNNEIKARVADMNGTPFHRFTACLLPLSRADIEFPIYGRFPNSGNNGYFTDAGIAPGKYVLAVEIFAPFENAGKKRFFYPQAESVKDAHVFDVASTTNLGNIEVRIPLKIRRVTGEYFRSTGERITENGSFTLMRLETEDEKINTTYDWGRTSTGRFDFQALEGFEYWVHAKLQEGEAVQKVKLGKEDQNVKVIFPRAARTDSK